MANPFLSTEIRGFEEVQRANIQLLKAVKPQGGLGQAVRDATLLLLQYAENITHVLTGTLASSHRADFGSGRVVTTFSGITFKHTAAGLIYIDETNINPFTGQRPAEYGIVEHDKGGSHEFYARTFREAGPHALLIAHSRMMEALPKGQGLGGFLSTRLSSIAGLPPTSPFALLPGN